MQSLSFAHFTFYLSFYFSSVFTDSIDDLSSRLDDISNTGSYFMWKRKLVEVVVATNSVVVNGLRGVEAI